MLAVLTAVCADARAQDYVEEQAPVDVPAVEAQPVEEQPQPQPEPPMEQPPQQPEFGGPPQEEVAPELPVEENAPVMPAVRPSRPQRPVVTPPPRPRPNRNFPTPGGGPMIPGAPAPIPGTSSATPGATQPDGPSNDEKTGESATAPVNFDYRDAPLSEVIEGIARLTGKNFDVDPNIGALTVTIITHDRIPPEMAYQVLESILSSRGFSMVQTLDGNLIKILPTPDASGSAKNPLFKDASVDKQSYDKYSTHIIQVKHADPTELANALKILGSQTAKIDVYVPTNTLIITDVADGLKRMFEFLEQADIPGQETAMEIFQLTYTRAEVLTQQIEQVLLEQGTGARGGAQPGGPTPAPQRAPVRGRPAIPGQSQSQVIGSNAEVLRMVSDERLNSMIVVATAGMMEKVRDLVERLDTPTPYEANTLHIYELLNAEAEQVEQALQGLVGGGEAVRAMAARRAAAPTSAAAPASRPRRTSNAPPTARVPRAAPAAAQRTFSPSSSPSRSPATTRQTRSLLSAPRRTGSSSSQSSPSSMSASAKSTSMLS